jgi:hypothetical protein
LGGSGRNHLTIYHDNVALLVDRILQEVGKDIVLGLPLGLGKANHIANELYARAAADRSISLRIFTGLTLEPKRWKTDLERRLLEPLNARLYSGSAPCRGPLRKIKKGQSVRRKASVTAPIFSDSRELD